ncbi:hypothetical protein XI04_03360 [Bradyrhizobium sp. CCBAU 11430]|nr:hypothetical protein [Bradyrhizobium sp. CCBAU 11430]
MDRRIYAKGVDFAQVEEAIREALRDAGSSKELAAAGVQTPPGFTDELKIAKGQGMSPGEWTEIIATFGPLAATVAEDVWTIVVVPFLKRKFRDDRIATNNPNSTSPADKGANEKK